MTDIDKIIILLKNTTASGIMLYDMSGATISGYAGQGGSDYYPLTDYFSFSSVNISEDLPPLVASGTLTVNNGVEDLSIEDGLKHIRYASAYETGITIEDEIGATTFLDLLDTPTTYSGFENKHLTTTESGVVFTTPTFLELDDTPTTYSGGSRFPVIVNESETGLEFGLIPETAISGTYFVSYEGGRLLRGATGNRPDLVYVGPIAGLAFDAAKTESCYGSFKIPYSWHSNTEIELKINFMNDDAQTGVTSISWHLAFHAYQEGEFYSDKILTTLHIDADLPSDIAAGKFMIKDILIPYDDVDNPLSVGDTVTFQFYREGLDSNDDAVGDAILISLSFELQTGDLSQLAG